MGAPGEGESVNGAETKFSELRAVINYLRKEKEIVDMQLELCKQENARLKTQIGHLHRDLEDTRATLSDVSLSLALLLFFQTRPWVIVISLFFRNESVLPLWPQQTHSTRN